MDIAVVHTPPAAPQIGRLSVEPGIGSGPGMIGSLDMLIGGDLADHSIGSLTLHTELAEDFSVLAALTDVRPNPRQKNPESLSSAGRNCPAPRRS
jgi:hypothetical protein